MVDMEEHSAAIIDAGLPDPFILPSGGRFFLYGSWKAPDGRFLPVYRSDDLRAWEFVRGAVEPGGEGAWNRRNFWAPEVLFSRNRYWLYYTATPEEHPENVGNRVGLAVADSPEGPFEDAGVVIDHASLDGSPFVDLDGSLYLYFVSENGNARGLPAGRIYVDRLLAPDRAAGEPVELIGRHDWQEGPCVLRRFERYYLFFSLGSWGEADYRVAWAVSDSPVGPFEEGPDLLLESSRSVKGPGHNNFFRGPDGEDWTVYHGWDPAFTARYPRVARVAWRDGRPSIAPPHPAPPGVQFCA